MWLTKLVVVVITLCWSEVYCEIPVSGLRQLSSNDALIFFIHADYGKGGYDGNQENRRRQLQQEQDYEEEDHEHEEEENDHKKEDEFFYQGMVADAMSLTAQSTPPKFIMALGDNFYPDGVYNAVNDSTWQTFYRDVYYNRFDELKGVPWHPAVGNHDLGYGDSGVQALIDRTNSTYVDDDGGEWQMPARYYTVKYDIPNDGGFVQVIVVDTTWLAPNTNEATNEEGGVNTTTQANRLYDQMSFLITTFQKTLEYPRPRWLLVMGHYQIFSAGDKG